MIEKQGRLLEDHSERFDDLGRQINRLANVTTFTLGQTTETQFQQTEQQKRADELFGKFEQLLSRS